jgi:hypothetical protein
MEQKLQQLKSLSLNKLFRKFTNIKEAVATTASFFVRKIQKKGIVLSTNSEIDPSNIEYRFMKDFISKEYTIISNNYKSSFEDGYFNEITRG